MQPEEETIYNTLSDDERLEVQNIVLDEDIPIMEAIERVTGSKKVQTPKPVVKSSPKAPVKSTEDDTDQWETTQQIMIDKAWMDQIAMIYASCRRDMDGSTKKIHEEHISTSKGHGFRVRIFGGNICIEKRKRKE